jgi:hypothetical protein
MFLQSNYSFFYIALKSKESGIEFSNSANVLLLLRIVLSFSYKHVISGVYSTWTVALEDTVVVGAGLIALPFNSGDDISMETLDYL